MAKIRLNIELDLSEVEKYFKPFKAPKPKRKTEKVEILSSMDNDFQDIVTAWNALPKPFLRVRLPLSNTRKINLKKLLKEFEKDTIINAIQEIPKSKFLSGGGSKGWVCSFNFILKEGKMEGLVEGAYADHQKETMNDIGELIKVEW